MSQTAWQFRAVQKLGAREVKQIRQSEEAKRQASEAKQASWLKSFSEDLIGKIGESRLQQIADSATWVAAPATAATAAGDLRVLMIMCR